MSQVQSLKRPRQVSGRLFSCAKTFRRRLDSGHAGASLPWSRCCCPPCRNTPWASRTDSSPHTPATHSFRAETDQMRLSESTHLLVLLIVFHDSWCRRVRSGWSPARLSSDDRPEKIKHLHDVCSVLFTHGGSVRTQNTDYKNNITTILPTAWQDFTFFCTQITHAPQRTCDLDVVCVSVHLFKSFF